MSTHNHCEFRPASRMDPRTDERSVLTPRTEVQP
jgi:hypothetical protein